MAGVALVTGGAVRIGRAIVADLAAHGWAVAIHARTSRKDAEALAAEIRQGGGAACVLTGDLADPMHAAEIVPAARAALGPVTLLVNNASLFLPDEIETLRPELLMQHFSVNLAAPCILARDLAAGLPPGTAGNIVNVVDQRVLKPTPRFFSYTLSKSALWTATRTMAQALAPRIRVNAVAPGPALQSIFQGEDDFARQVAAVPLGRGPGLAEFGRAIRFLVGTPSITGQILTLDGGQHLAWQTPDVIDVGE